MGSDSSPMDCAMIYWGKQKEKFLKVFSDIGYVCE